MLIHPHIYLEASSDPSIMTWPPVSPSLLYSSENHPPGLSETKFVFSCVSAPELDEFELSASEKHEHWPLSSVCVIIHCICVDIFHHHQPAWPFTHPICLCMATMMKSSIMLNHLVSSGRSFKVDPTICLTLPCIRPSVHGASFPHDHQSSAITL